MAIFATLLKARCLETAFLGTALLVLGFLTSSSLLNEADAGVRDLPRAARRGGFRVGTDVDTFAPVTSTILTGTRAGVVSIFIFKPEN